jgi:hypothetical protein
VENDEYAAFVRRVLRGYARRVARGDIDAIADMAAIAGELDGVMRQAVGGLRGAGYSWAEIAARLGVTRQAAQQRWGGSGRELRQPRHTCPPAPGNQVHVNQAAANLCAARSRGRSPCPAMR